MKDIRFHCSFLSPKIGRDIRLTILYSLFCRNIERLFSWNLPRRYQRTAPRTLGKLTPVFFSIRREHWQHFLLDYPGFTGTPASPLAFISLIIYRILDTERANIACFNLSKQELAPRLFSNVGGTMAGLSLSAEMSFSPALHGFCIGFHFGNKKQDSILMYLCFVLDFLSS